MNVVSYLSIETCIAVVKDLWSAIRDGEVGTDTLDLFDRILQHLRDEGYTIRYVSLDSEWGDGTRTLVVEQGVVYK